MRTLTKGWVGPLKQATEGKRPWVCDYACPLSGKMKRKKIAEAGANKKDREQAHRDFERSLTDGRQLTQMNATLNDALDVYLEWCEQLHRANDRMSAGTLERIGQTIKKHLRPDLGYMLLGEIDSPLIEDYIYKKGEGVRCKHFDIYHTLKKALERAVWKDLLLISPLDVKKLRLPPYPESRTTMPTIEEGRAFWHALLHEGRSNARISSHCNITRMTSVALSMFGGMSCGEMCGLQWEYVNFTAPIPWIWIEHSQSRYAGVHGKLKEPKAPSRHRYIVIGPEMNVWLTQTAKRDGYPRTGYVFKPEPSSSRTGGAISTEATCFARSRGNYSRHKCGSALSMRMARRNGQCTIFADMPAPCG